MNLDELTAQNAALLKMAELCKKARLECMSPRSVQARLLDEAIRVVDPSWEGARHLPSTVPWPTNGELGTTRLKAKR